MAAFITIIVLLSILQSSVQIRDLRIVFLRSNRISNRIGRPIRFRIESAVYTTQAVTPSNDLQCAPCRRTV